MVFNHAWRTLTGQPVPINQLVSLRRASLLPAQVRDVIHELGCASRRRGCRAGRRARDRLSTYVNINNAPQSADRSVHYIPTVSSRLPSSLLQASRCRGMLYYGHRERRKPVRRPLQPEPQLRPSSTSGTTAVGLLNARSVRFYPRQSSSADDYISWHDDVHSQLIASTPLGYRFIEKARPPSESAALSTGTNHGGLCLCMHRFSMPEKSRCQPTSPAWRHLPSLSMLPVVIYWQLCCTDPALPTSPTLSSKTCLMFSSDLQLMPVPSYCWAILTFILTLLIIFILSTGSRCCTVMVLFSM